jgi:hypothetical protein
MATAVRAAVETGLSGGAAASLLPQPSNAQAKPTGTGIKRKTGLPMWISCRQQLAGS